MKVRLDEIDWQILKELQANGRMTNVELARRAGISAPPCLRRVRALEEAGLITGYRGLLSLKDVGFTVVGFAMVGLSQTNEADLIAFEQHVRDWSIVRECYLLSGEVDFLLKCVAVDLTALQSFIINDLTPLPMVGSVRTALTIRTSKAEPLAPL